MPEMPDLLNSHPREPSNLEGVRSRLQFAFASGASAGELRRVVAETEGSPSTWDPDCFAADLLVDDLVSSCFPFDGARFGDGFEPPQSLQSLRNILVHPPDSLDSVYFRQDILAELVERPDLRTSFELAYRRLVELRREFDSPPVMGWEYSTRRQIDLLLGIKSTADFLALQLEGASSGLRRIPEWATAFQGSDGYAQLRDFVDYEGCTSSVQLQFRVGLDGSIRNLAVVRLVDNTRSRFHLGPLGRLWSLLRLWWRGGRVGADELVAHALQALFDAVQQDLARLLVLVGHMEFYLAGLAFRQRCEARGLATCRPRFVEPSAARAVHGMFNPFLLGAPGPPVPCDLRVPRPDATTIVTGPNSGGKTRLLQTLAVVQLFGQSGLPVPAASAELWYRPGIYLSLIREVAADQVEGRLGTELLRVRRLFESLRPGSLVLLDELCSGTNPSEAEEIMLLVLSLLRDLHPEAYVTTHFLRFARRLGDSANESPLVFLKVGLDADDEPTYQFVAGVAERSLAGRTARRLGVTREELRRLVSLRIKAGPPFPRASRSA